MRGLIVAICSVFLLLGCSEEDVESVEERSNPEENVEITEKSKTTEEVVEETTWNDSPPDVTVRGESGGQVMAIRDTYCWGEDDGEACTRTPSDPAETTMGTRASMVVNKGEEIEFTLNNVELPDPNQLIVTQFRMNEDEGEVVGSIENNWHGVFQAPEEGGRHYYLAHALWDGEVVGEAYYAFYMIVR